MKSGPAPASLGTGYPDLTARPHTVGALEDKLGARWTQPAALSDALYAIPSHRIPGTTVWAVGH